ncbi:MAG: T9SS type A sorting domain-containing protein, partial [Flavobacteriales bacterium]|nr:T9SS type A sorting domain-containing protein [Flavobacteriales bacterium]
GNLTNSSELILTDNIGRIVSITEIDRNKTTHKINVSNLSKGIYFITVDNNKIIKKIVKQ